MAKHLATSPAETAPTQRPVPAHRVLRAAAGAACRTAGGTGDAVQAAKRRRGPARPRPVYHLQLVLAGAIFDE